MKKIIYVDMDDVLCDYTKSYNTSIEKNPAIQFPQSQYGFFRNLEPIQGGIEAVGYLKSQSKFDVYILTAPSVKNPLCYIEKRLWIEDHLGMALVDKLIISPNKGLNKGDYLIDDQERGRGQEHFEGTLIQFGKGDFKNWVQVMDYFKKNYDLVTFKK